MQLVKELRNNPPLFHFWGGEERKGGFGNLQLDLLKQSMDLVDEGQKIKCVETGAGLSTAWFLAHGARLQSFFIEQALGDRITEYMEENKPGALKRWKYHVGPSELTMPKFVNRNPEALFDICLIDGGHGIHTVFTDFTYQNYLLREGGIMLVDDIQLGSCRLLWELMKAEDSFEYVADAKKLVAFRKTNDKRFLPDFGGQKFLGPLLEALTS